MEPFEICCRNMTIYSSRLRL